jgi:glycosyltransferase involved in cell wall biosynthesis
VFELLFYGYFRSLKKINPDVVISFVPFTNFASFLPKLIFGLKYKLIVSEHAHVSGAMADNQNMDNYFQKIYSVLFKSVYNSSLVDKLIVIAKESQEDLELNHGIISSKMVLINNPVGIQNICKKSIEEPNIDWFSKLISNDDFIIINSGRLVHQKRHDILIQAFSKVYKKNNSLKLVILGGGDKSDLDRIIKGLGLEKSVFFAGFQSNPWSWVSRAKLFVLSSCWEGLPCVLAETMALNVPIVSTDCPSGPKEMLENGELGLLAKTNDIESLAEKIEFAINNYHQMKQFANLAKNRIVRYEPIFVTKQYEQLIESVLQC